MEETERYSRWPKACFNRRFNEEEEGGEDQGESQRSDEVVFGFSTEQRSDEVVLWVVFSTKKLSIECLSCVNVI